VSTVGNAFLIAIVRVILLFLTFIEVTVVVAALISWVSPDPRNPIVQILYRMTEPILRPFRRILPPQRTGGIDFSPIFVILIIEFLKVFVPSLFAMPYRAY
jgi:YggT family protein